MNASTIIRAIPFLRKAAFQLVLVMVALLFTNAISIFYQDGHACAIELTERGEADTGEENGKQAEQAEKDKHLGRLFQSKLKNRHLATIVSVAPFQWCKPWIEIFTPPPQVT